MEKKKWPEEAKLREEHEKHTRPQQHEARRTRSDRKVYKRGGRARTYGVRPIEVRERLTPARPGLGTVARARGAREGIPAGGEEVPRNEERSSGYVG